jgi:hypothetical protein
MMNDDRAAMSFCHLVTGLGIAIFTPTILETFGYTAVRSVLLTIPMSLCSVTWGVLNAIVADRYQHRSSLLLLQIAIAAVGLSMAGWDTRRHVRLGGLFLAHISFPPFLLS